MSKTLNIDFKRRYFQNYAINGNLRYWQRGTMVTRTQAASQVGYLADRFIVNVSTGGSAKSITIDRSTDLPTLKYPALYSYQVTNNTVLSPMDVGGFIEPFRQVFEGQLIKHLNSGHITVGFWMFSSFSGVTPVALRNTDVSMSYVTTLNVTAGWAYYSVQVDLSPITIPNTTAAGLSIEVGAISSSALHAPSLNGWLSGNYISHSTATNWAASTGVKFRFAQFQVREGRIAPQEMQDTFSEFMADSASELMACQRYFEKNHDVDVTPTFGTTYVVRANGHTASDLIFYGSSYTYKAQKRVAALITLYGTTSGPGIVHTQMGAASGTDEAGTGSFSTEAGFTPRRTATATAGTQGAILFNFTADAEF